jgi:hypothetical protein
LLSAPLVHCADTSAKGDHHHATGGSGRHRDAKDPHQCPGVVRAQRRKQHNTIASLPRGSVQLGFNEVANRTLGVVGVARPHGNQHYTYSSNF